MWDHGAITLVERAVSDFRQRPCDLLDLLRRDEAHDVVITAIQLVGTDHTVTEWLRTISVFEGAVGEQAMHRIPRLVTLGEIVFVPGLFDLLDQFHDRVVVGRLLQGRRSF